MSDKLIRGEFADSHIRFAVCHVPALCSEAVRRHRCDWISGWLLSEALVCAALLSATLKDDQKYTLRWMYPGPVGTILADSGPDGEVRGFTQRVSLAGEVESLAEATGGTGRLSVVTSTRSRLLRTGITEAIFQDLARDLAYFLSLSFQIETALAVGLNMPPEEPVQVPSASGLLMQPLPGCDPMEFDRVRQAVETQSFRDWLEAEPRAAGDILGRVALDEAPRYYGELEPEYTCQCSREKADNILRMIEPEELTDMIEKDGQAEINCHFCADSYLFSKVELREILRQSQAGNA